MISGDKLIHGKNFSWSNFVYTCVFITLALPRLIHREKYLWWQGSCEPRKCLTQDLKLDNSNSLEITIVKLAQVLHKMLLCVCLGIVQKLRAGVKVSKGSDSDTVWGMKLGL